MKVSLHPERCKLHATKAVILLAVFLMAMAGCRHAGKTDARLDTVENVMESRPDSAMTILDSIAPADLSGDSQKARYALLKSMALDKNYVDTTSFDVLQPAIDYYLKKGSPDEKLKTYYYQGRIYQNRNERDSALHSFMKGLDIANECKDSLTIARALVAQGILYKGFYDMNSYAENYLKAAEILSRRNLDHIEFDCLINALNGMVLIKNKEKADSIIGILDKLSITEDYQKRMLRGVMLSYKLKFGSNQDIREYIVNSSDSIPYDITGLLDLARAYNQIGENRIAMDLVRYVDQSQVEYDQMKFFAIKYRILEDSKDFKNALATYKDYIYRLETINSAKIDQKSRSIEEKHQMELQAERDKRMHQRIIWGVSVGVVASVLVMIILILYVRSSRIQKRLAIQKARTAEIENEKLKSESENLSLENRNLQLERDKKALEVENMAHRIDELESESAELKKLLESHDEMPQEVRKAIQVRVEMLNSYLAGQITDNDDFGKTYDAWVEELTANTEDFMNSNRLAFQASHPAFIKYFEDHGLTESEINYVCLYAIGLRGKEVGSYMKKRSHVNISSAIRKKLGIDKHETNIGIYVRRLLKNL